MQPMQRTRPGPDEELWLLSPDARERAAAAAPDAEVLGHALDLINQGVTVIPGAIPGELCDRAVESFRRWCSINADHTEPFRDEYGHYPRIHNLHQASTAIARLFSRNPRALAVQDFCFGYRTAADSSLFFTRGTSQRMHRDLPYFFTDPLHFYSAMWVALEDVHPDNGPLVVCRGGHRIPIDRFDITRRHHPPDEPIGTVCPHLWEAYQQELNEACDAQNLITETLLLNKGDTVIWHPLLPHGGAPLRDPTLSRFSIVFHTAPEGVPVHRGNVFFDQAAKPPPDFSYHYRELDQRLFADYARAEIPPGSRNYY
jgi:hypothetical protein